MTQDTRLEALLQVARRIAAHFDGTQNPIGLAALEALAAYGEKEAIETLRVIKHPVKPPKLGPTDVALLDHMERDIICTTPHERRKVLDYLLAIYGHQAEVLKG